ncbi:BIRC2 [Branchiostoma lanceolatum]|uniref:BIRC2 protein n=1 Tax=Branchiostoma lanceolatum TaxID=7740 RepID=A0A8J9Z1B8_BRALA|nr:BIRC2 [Branchiostoma lanceolatum]
MTDVSRPAVRKSPEPSGRNCKLRARKPPGWRAKPPVPSSSIRFQAVPFTDSTPTRLPPPPAAVPFNNGTPTRLPVPPPALLPAACQSPEVNSHHHDNNQSGASLIPSPSKAVRSVMTGAMRLTGLVRETMVKVTHAASATTSVVTRTCCADNTKTESSHHTATFSSARQTSTESYQMAIPTDDSAEVTPRPRLGQVSMMAIPSNESEKTGPKRGDTPLTKKCKAVPVRKTAPVRQKSEQEPSSEGSPDSQPDQDLRQTYSVSQLRKLFGETYSVDKPQQSEDVSDTYTVASQGKDLGSTFVIRAENAEEVSAQPYERASTHTVEDVGAQPFDSVVKAENSDEVDAQPYERESADTVRASNVDDFHALPFDRNLTFNKGRKLCLMAIPAEPHEEEEEDGGPAQGATNAPQPPSLTEAMKSMVVKNIVREGYGLELVRHAVWRRLQAGSVLSGPELLQAVKDLEQEYTAAEKKLGDKDFLKEKEEVNLTLAMEQQVVRCVLSQGHYLETVRHVVWRRLQEGKGPFKSAPELLQGVTDLKREYEKAGKKLDNSEKTFEEKTVEYKDGGGKTVDAVREPLQRANCVADAMASLVVETVLRAGYDRDLVQHATWRRLETHGENFASIAELLQALKDLEDEIARAKEKLGNDELPNTPPAVVMTTTPESENTPSTEDIPPSPTADSGTAQPTCKVATGDNVESELERYREEHTCKVCFDARIEVVFVPCGHYACCGHCADGMVECPMCRRGVDSTVKVFFS